MLFYVMLFVALCVFVCVQGYFNFTVMYYGSYSNETLAGLVDYDMQLAYFFTISAYMVLCGIVLIFRLARLTFRRASLINLC